MDEKTVISRCDHTQLSQIAGKKDIITLCEEAEKYGAFSVCVPPCYVRLASEYLKEKNSAVKVCTVIGFPNGYNSAEVKVFETQTAVREGADEIDAVINVGMLKNKDYDGVLAELRAIRGACESKILKVIIETCLLTDDEKRQASKLVYLSGADFVKTSTGFGGGGATVNDVKIMRESVPEEVKIKAAGGISGFDFAEQLLQAGADRLGTSRLIKEIKRREGNSVGENA